MGIAYSGKRTVLACFLLILLSSTNVSAQSLSVTGIANPGTANGIYEENGTLNGKTAWRHTSGGFYIYWDLYGGDPYWNIDNDQDDNNDVLFYRQHAAVTAAHRHDPGKCDGVLEINDALLMCSEMNRRSSDY